MKIDCNDRPTPRGHFIVLFEVGLLTHCLIVRSQPSHPSCPDSLRRTMAHSKNGATIATLLGSRAAHSGRTVPELPLAKETHRSSLFTSLDSNEIHHERHDYTAVAFAVNRAS